MAQRKKTRRAPRSNPRGVLRVSADGYGFVHTAEGEFFVPTSKMGGAFDGDLVELHSLTVNKKHKQPDKKHSKTGERPTARVVRIIDRAHETLIGRYEIAEPFGVIVPQDTRIPYDVFTMRADYPHVEEGDIVRVRITNFPSRNTAATGAIEEVVGHEGDRSLGIDMIVARHKLETTFSAASLAQAAAAKNEVDQALSSKGYQDLRERKVFTIDPDDARDFDDALSFDEVDGLFRLGVHIADVATYVDWGSSIDLDARRRATSVYLADRVIPMLPEALSNELCSLKPNQDRLTLTVDMYLDTSFRVKRSNIYPSVICSVRRFTYNEVQEILADKNSQDSFAHKLGQLNSVAKALAAKRTADGCIDFVTTEAKVQLNDEGTPVAISLRKKTDATEIIEEAMILANTIVASFLNEKSYPCIYRVHEAPSPESLSELVPILQEFDYYKDIPLAQFIAGSAPVLQNILERSKGRPEEELISYLLLRAMKRANYEPKPSRHYGLAREFYCHFTSPIRRYPDLVVHRMLHAYIQGKSSTFEEQSNSLEWLSEHSSKMERIAELAARDSQEVKIAEYMKKDIGATFDGIITSVANYGFFVRLDNTAEGLVSVRRLGDEYFTYDPSKHTLTGEESGKRYRLGQRVHVVLESVDERLGRLDFHLSSRDN